MKKFLSNLFRFVFLSVLAVNYLTTAQAAPGALDTTFKGTGKVKTDFGFGADGATASAVQADGKIITLGWAGEITCALTRYNADGTPDYSFGDEGKVLTFIRSVGRAVLIQTDGKILIAGTSFEQSAADFLVARFNPDGSFDASFGVNGLVRTPIGFFADEAWTAALQTDGKIVLAGWTYNSIGTEGKNIAVVRYNANGSLDTTFDGDGKLTTDIGGLDNEAYSVAVQADGKILLGGSSSIQWVGSQGFLVRYNPDGSLDTSFDGDGIVISAIGSRSGLGPVAVQPDGKIVAAGNFHDGAKNVFVVARYNADGSPDTTFDTDGQTTVSVSPDNAYSRSIIVQANQKIVVFGTTLSPNSASGNFAALRFNADGSLDTSFDADGIVMTNFDRPYNSLSSGIIQPDGKLLGVGTAGNVYGGDFALARYNADGSLDTSFDTDGKVTTAVAYRPAEGRAVLVQSDNKIVVAGQVYKGALNSFTMVFGLTRYNPDGSLDATFGDGGIVTTLIGNSAYAAAAVLQPDGKIIVAGSAGGEDQTDIALARYNLDGSLDTTFDGDGIVITRVDSEDARAHSIALQPDGKIVLGGYGFSAGYKAMLFRYNPDGSLDNSFGDGGKAISPGMLHVAVSVAIQPDGKIVAAGRALAISSETAAFVVARHNADGSLDTSFDFDGITRASFGVNIDEVRAVAVQPDGKIVAVGTIYFSSSVKIGVVRFNADGTLDSTFDGDGKVITSIGTRDDLAHAVIIQPDGKIIVAGETTIQVSSSGISHDFAAIRYNADGSLDNSWGTNGVATVNFGDYGGRAFGAALDSDGRLILTGIADIRFGTARLQGDITPKASIRGRVVTTAGMGIKDARITVTSGNLPTRIYAYTNPFGYYQIEGIPIGETYQITVSSKRHTFNQPTLTLVLRQNYENANFTGTLNNSRSTVEEVRK